MCITILCPPILTYNILTFIKTCRVNSPTLLPFCSQVRNLYWFRLFRGRGRDPYNAGNTAGFF